MPGPLFPIQNFVAKPYAGSLQGINVSLLSRGGVTTNDGQTVQSSKTSKTVNVQIDFLSTQYKGQAVTVNLQSGANTPPLQKILMIYVDNELNSQNVTVAFLDTFQFIGVPAFTTGYYPVLTGQLQAVVYNGTTGKVPVTAQSQVSVMFCDFAIPGFLSQETLSVTFNGSNGPVVPVIGDTVQTNTFLQGEANPLPILAVVTAPIQYVLTGIEINAVNLFADPSFGTTNPWLTIMLYDPTTSGAPPIRLFVLQLTPDFTDHAFKVICDETGLNIPFQGVNMLMGGGSSPLPPNDSIPITLPVWCAITVSLTYAKVTL